MPSPTTIEADGPSGTESSYLFVHRVQCHPQDGSNHSHHTEEKDYLDVPCLLTDSNQTTMLKGKRSLDNVEWYLEDNPSQSFAVINTYDCIDYHREIADSFERVSLPSSIDSHILGQVRPYLYVLKKNAKEADRIKQTLLPSPGLTRALNMLQSSLPLELRDWDEEGNLTYPYPQLWHCRDVLHDAAEELTPREQSYVMTLLEFLQSHVSTEWLEAEAMFENGMVSRQHWTKLFRPDEPIVTTIDGEPRAFICKEDAEVFHDTLHLPCWSWEFDGHFFRQDFAIKIKWPDQSDVAMITDLSHYPLRYDDSDLEQRLHSRGLTFWSCRQRRYISYESASQDAIVQAVSICYFEF